jgi:hypothetical protein
VREGVKESERYLSLMEQYNYRENARKRQAICAKEREKKTEKKQDIKTG